MELDITIPLASMITMGFSALICFLLPIGSFIYLRKKMRADWLPFAIGAIIFIVFALILEPLLHRVVLFGGYAWSAIITSNFWLYALYGGFAAGIFEESGRYFAFRYILFKKARPVNALMYGAGHGGIEALLIAGSAMISNLIFSISLNNNGLSAILENAQSAAVASQISATAAAIATANPVLFLMSGAERISAVILQIALSVLVYAAVYKRSKWFFFPLAVVLHATVNTATVLLNLVISPYILEPIIFAMAGGSAYLAYKVYCSLDCVQNHSDIVCETGGTE